MPLPPRNPDRNNVLADPTSHPAHVLLSLAHPPETASTLFAEKVAHRPLFFVSNPTAGQGQDGEKDKTQADKRASLDGRARRRQIRERRIAERQRDRAYKRAGKPKPLTAREKRAMGVHSVSRENRKWDVYVPLWRMWVDYARDVLNIEPDREADNPTDADANSHHDNRPPSQFLTPASSGPLIASMDFHGALVEVAQCRCVGRVGTFGIVLRDTKFTFELITPENEIKTIPKEMTLFRIRIPLARVPEISNQPIDAELSTSDKNKVSPLPGAWRIPGRCLMFDINGSRFANRAPDRATKKIKDVFGPNATAGGG